MSQGQLSETTPKRMVVPIKLSSSSPKKKGSYDHSVRSSSSDSQAWQKREFAVFMKSVMILNQGLSQLKISLSEDSANEITCNTYVRLITNLIETVGKSRKSDLTDKLVAAVVVDSVSTQASSVSSSPYPSKRKRSNLV